MAALLHIQPIRGTGGVCQQYVYLPCVPVSQICLALIGSNLVAFQPLGYPAYIVLVLVEYQNAAAVGCLHNLGQSVQLLAVDAVYLPIIVIYRTVCKLA